MKKKRMNPDLWCPFYGQDFDRDTLGWHRADKWSYWSALWAYWVGKCRGLPSDDDILRRICECEKADWARCRGLIFGAPDKFFQHRGFWHQKNAQERYKEAVESMEKASNRGKSGAEARWSKDSPSNAQAEHEECNTDATSKSKQQSKQELEVPSKSTTVSSPSLPSAARTPFDSVRIANKIIADEWEWYWDNCKVNPSDFKTRPLASVIEAFLPKSETEIQAAWIRAVKIAHAAAVDGLIKENAAGYCIQCFRDECK